MRGGVGTLIFIVIAVVIGIARNTPSWETIDDDSVNLGPDQSYVLEYSLPTSTKVRVTASETNDNSMLAYWVSSIDHAAIQNGTTTENDYARIMSGQSFVSGAASGTGERELPTGQIFIYLETIEDVDAHINFKVEAYQ